MLILIIICLMTIGLIYLHPKITNSEPFEMEPSLPPMGETYQQKINELNDVDRVLDRPLRPPNKDIYNISLLPSSPDALTHYPASKSNIDDIHRDYKLSPGLYSVLAKYSPYDKPEIVQYYSEYYYRDWRFPEKPISIKFAENPEKFIMDFPKQYPSYVILSRRTPSAPSAPSTT